MICISLTTGIARSDACPLSWRLARPSPEVRPPLPYRSSPWQIKGGGRIVSTLADIYSGGLGIVIIVVVVAVSLGPTQSPAENGRSCQPAPVASRYGRFIPVCRGVSLCVAVKRGPVRRPTHVYTDDYERNLVNKSLFHLLRRLQT